MSDSSTDSFRFYRERVPLQFNRTIDAQERDAEEDAAAAKLLEGMRTVNATIRVIVRRETGDEIHDLRVAGGRMTAGDAGATVPFMTLRHDERSFASIERESGDSLLGFLGALAGMQEDMKLTSQRIQNLSLIDGSLLFELTGDNPLSLLAHFGDGPCPDEPSCCLRMDSAIYADLKSGALPPQDAFMSGRVQIEGDMQIAMQLALAALSPD